MVYIHAKIPMENGESYEISVDTENPETSAELMLQARAKLLAGLKKKEDK